MSKELGKILQGHVLTVAPSIPDDSVSCIVTSPPYWAKRNCTGEGIIWPGEWCGQLGHEPTVSLYIQHLMQIFDEMYRILRKDGNLFVVIADTRSRGKRPKQDNWEDSLRKRGDVSSEPDLKPNYKLPSKSQCCVPELFKLAMMSRDWIARSTYIWVKTNPKPESVKDRFTDCFEYVYHFIKNKRYYFDMQYEPTVNGKDRNIAKNFAASGKCFTSEDFNVRNEHTTKHPDYNQTLRQMRGVFIGPIQPYKGAHFATYPEWLIEPLVKAGCPTHICNKCGRVARQLYETEKVKRKRLHDTTEPCKEAGQSPNDYAGSERIVVGYDFCDCAKGYHSGVVFDPFMGAGTTAVVAEKLGLDWSGIELSKQYIKMSYKRLNK